MKSFGQVSIGDELVLINSYNKEMRPQQVFKILNIKNNPTNSNNIEDHDLIEISTNRGDDDYYDSFNAKTQDNYAIDRLSFKYIITPIENFNVLQKIFNIGYLSGADNIRNGIKDILHI